MLASSAAVRNTRAWAAAPPPRLRREHEADHPSSAASRVPGRSAAAKLASGPDDGSGASSACTWAAATAEQEALADELVGPCEALRVVDGDTVDVSCEGHVERIRMLRIGTPERGQPGYGEAAEALAGMIDGEDVYLAFEERGQPARGHYGRLLPISTPTAAT